MTSTDRVTAAAQAYVARCLEVLRERCPAEGDTELELGFPRWLEDTRHEGTIARFGDFKTFRLTPDVWEPARVCAQRELARVGAEGIGEYRDFVAALSADPIIGQRLGNEVVGGAGLGGGPLQPEGIAQGLVLELVDQAKGFDPSPEMVAWTIARLLSNLRRERETVIAFAPLSDFVVAAPPIQLDKVVIDELTSEEISAALMLGSWPVSDFEHSTTSIGRFPLTAMVEPTFAIRSSHTVPVVVGGATPDEVNATLASQAEAARVAEEVLLALRLFKPGRVGLRGIVYATVQPLGQLWPIIGSRFGYGRRVRGEPYVLAAEEGAELGEWYAQLAAATGRNRLIDAAARRFGYAADRSRADDEVVDLVIAAESLFLGELGRPGERGELSYRLATRAASFTDGGVQARRQVLTFMRKAYAARSGIVHSGRLDEAQLRGLSGQPAPAAAFADDLEELLRRSLRKAVRSVASGQRFPPDWDELLFGRIEGQPDEPSAELGD